VKSKISRTSTFSFQQEQKKFYIRSRFKFAVLALVLVAIWFFSGQRVLSEYEDRLWERVRSAQLYLNEWRQSSGFAASPDIDPWDLGLTGVEWSPLTTTLGSLESKRTACNPLWSIVTAGWFDKLGMDDGGRIAIYSSSSFPGMLLNVLAAAEERDMEIFLILSLGSSTWGANSPDCPWPVMSRELRRRGYIHARADYYTLGGGEETGGSISPEGIALMEEIARRNSVQILRAEDLKEMVDLKTELMKAFSPDLLVSIGGSAANMGDDEDILKLPGGLLLPSEGHEAGNGVISRSLDAGIPVIHFLDLRQLSRKVGIPYDSEPAKRSFINPSPLISVAGLMIFFIVLLTHKRWKFSKTTVGKISK